MPEKLRSREQDLEPTDHSRPVAAGSSPAAVHPTRAGATAAARQLLLVLDDSWSHGQRAHESELVLGQLPLPCLSCWWWSDYSRELG